MSTLTQLTANCPATQLSIVPVTDTDPYNQLLDRINEEMKPVTEHECFLVDQMTHARWKLDRIRPFEDELLERTLMGENVAAKLALMMRCAAAAERSYFKAHREFFQSRRLNQKELAPPAELVKAIITPIAPLPNRPELALFRKIENPSRRI